MAQFAVQSERAAAAAPAVANPGPLGLCAFALTTFVLSSINAGLFPKGGENIVVGLALFYGGFAQILAGMWEFRTGNTFGATGFTSYGAFWLSFAAIFIPGTGILDAIVKANAVGPAVGLYLLGWTIFTGLMFFGTLRINMALVTVFALLFLAFRALTIGALAASPAFTVLGGWLGIVTALAAWYTALAGIRTPFALPVGARS